MIARLLLLMAMLLAGATPAAANWCAAPGRNGSGTISGVVNTYFPGTASVSAGATSISIGASSGAPQAIAAGDLLLVIQMQDATIDTRNNSRYGDGINQGLAQGYLAIQQTGRYEFVRAGNAVGIGGGSVAYSGGPSIGIRPFENGWLSLGWNLVGFHDRDFDEERYTRSGPYVTMRLKFDQLSLQGLGLGRRR